MREIVTVSVGQAGNQIGWRFWDVLVREHAACGFAGSSMDALSSFFRPAEGGLRVPGLLNQGLRARAVLVDMEEGVVAQMHRSSIRGLFDSTCSVTDVSGAGNNWAHGYAVCGPHHRAPITDRLRLALEACESPQAFFLTHSLGGGTGSGVGSYILELLADEFPEPYRITASLFPSDNDDVVTSPYNALLATSRLVDSADSVFSIENQALIDIMGAAAKGAQNEGGFAAAGDSSAAAVLKSAPASSSQQSSPKRDSAAPAVIPEETLPSAALRSILSVADDLLAASTTLPAVKSSAASAAQIYKSGGPPARGSRVATASSKTGIPTRGAKGIISGGIKQNSKTSVAQRLASAHQGVGRAAVRTDSNAQRESSTITGADEAREKLSSLRQSPPRVLSLQEEQRAPQQPEREAPAPATTPSATVTAAAPRSGTSWDAMNEFVARLLSDVTAGMRFPGSLNLDLNEIASTLVPFPRMHFLSTSMSPLSRRPSQAGMGLDALVSEALSRSNMLIRGNLRRNLNLACGIVLRGQAVAVSDVVQTVRRLGSDLLLPSWNPDGFKVSICSQHSPFAPMSAAIVSNSTGVSVPLNNLYSRFLSLYRVRAHLHHYLEDIDADEFQLAAVSVDGVIKAYEEERGQ